MQFWLVSDGIQIGMSLCQGIQTGHDKEKIELGEKEAQEIDASTESRVDLEDVACSCIENDDDLLLFTLPTG